MTKENLLNYSVIIIIIIIIIIFNRFIGPNSIWWRKKRIADEKGRTEFYKNFEITEKNPLMKLRRHLDPILPLS